MNPKDVCELYELTDDRGQGSRGIYVLGSLLGRTERVAVVSQQTRAINLIHSLIQTGRLDAGDRLCLIGAGAAGLTAAAYAISKGLATTVLESCAPLWNLRGCRTRWLHPNLFRWWPEDEWNCTATHLPVMNWYADYASNVGDLLLSKYRSFESMQSASARLQSPGLWIARDIELEPRNSGWRVAWGVPGEGTGIEARQQDDFEAVVAAIGFGSEARIRDTEASTYWLDDTLERNRPAQHEIRYLISGTGDGGLTDLLRVRLDGFRHHHLRDSLLKLDYANELIDKVRAIERAIAADRAFDPTARYMALAREFRFGALLKRRRYTTKALLVNLGEGALMSNAWPISRFLAATLLEHDGEFTQYRANPVSWTAATVTPDAGHAEPQPHHFDVTFKNSAVTERVDAIVIRHGPQKAMSRAGTLVNWADATLEDFGLPWTSIAAARRKWESLAAAGTTTDHLIAPKTNEEGRRRSRAASVIPPMGGRTVIGMLSRLVSSVAPEDEADHPRGDLKVSHDLVTDSAAALLAQLVDQIPEGSNTNSAKANAHAATSGANSWRWRLGAELDRKCAIEVIAGVDVWLGPLWKDAMLHRADLERTWVLPRAPWIKAGRLLKNTRVARHWADWALQYEQVAGQPAASREMTRIDKEEKVLAALAQVPSATEAAREDHRLAVIDLCDLRLRAAVYHNPLPRPERLARELGANILVISETQYLRWVSKKGRN